MTVTRFILQVLLALCLGGFIGLERQWRKCAAGLRTNVLVSVGAALFMGVGAEIGGTGPERIASYIVSGIGFLGAGVILKDGASVRGLNTAATLWCTAAIGAYCGMGHVLEPFLGSVFIVAIHLCLRPLSDWIRRVTPVNAAEREEYRYRFTASCHDADESRIRTMFMQYISGHPKLMLRSISSSDVPESGIVAVDMELLSPSPLDREMEKFASFLTLDKTVLTVKWESLENLVY